MKEYIHKFRNALLQVVDYQSHKYFMLPRWGELNSFPFGSCDIANNMLAAYLREKGFEPKIIWCLNNHESYPDVKSHVWIQVENEFIDITANQFTNYVNSRIYIVQRHSPEMLNEIYDHCKPQGIHYFKERDIDLTSATSSAGALYREVANIANSI
ncbi:hypothetical protein [Aeromonas diversa]|uniref:hypothetical protein n=1 Tax=Aeromonas diversa TaxID=502790 RepID=UPI0005B93C47|nr:hypothetical protein [Aeromonas diversa]